MGFGLVKLSFWNAPWDAKINENLFISLIPHNMLMQIESPNNMLHISILSLNLLLNLGV
jgi:hypothetical protein